MAQIQVVRSFVAGPALAEVIDNEYDLGGKAEARLFSKMLRTQDNDHYKVIVGDQIYAARIYQFGDHLHRQESDYEYELDWLNFLKEQELARFVPHSPQKRPFSRQCGSARRQTVFCAL